VLSRRSWAANRHSLNDRVCLERAEIINAIDEAFSGEPRPAMFIRGTCSCEECTEHNETMSRLKLSAFPIDVLNNPGWDPICFASDAAFRYLMPGLALLVLNHPEDYIQQFLFHVEQPDRIACLSHSQAHAVVRLLDLLAVEASEAVGNNHAADALFRTRNQLEQAEADRIRDEERCDTHLGAGRHRRDPHHGSS